VSKVFGGLIAIGALVGAIFLFDVLTPTENTRYIYENGAVLIGGDDEPIELINNPDASNPTYAQLIEFIMGDDTDKNDYVEKGSARYICADFAEDIHNNAEAMGIRAAWVSLDFEGSDKGHAINAFNTSDKGMVYIDCTGGEGNPAYISQIAGYLELPLLLSNSKCDSYDCVAYVEIGEEYGAILLDYAKSVDYSFYEEYKGKKQEYEILLSDYNYEVEQYNEEISGKVYYEGSPELIRIKAWEASLEDKRREIDELANELGDCWFEPMGIVEDVHIYWGP
jgi:hypothetical protein